MRKAAVLAIRLYQLVLSPLLGRQCRFYPSCSSYTKEAIEKHGVLKGIFLGGKRLLKCHPFHPGGVDLVP
jgi:putative membrane protein insertion efficiency factor